LGKKIFRVYRNRTHTICIDRQASYPHDYGGCIKSDGNILTVWILKIFLKRSPYHGDWKNKLEKVLCTLCLSLILFILLSACKSKRACSTCTPGHMYCLVTQTSKYRKARVTAPCLLCMKFLHPVMLILSRLFFWSSERKARDVAIVPVLLQHWKHNRITCT
jgi:hypothetical protein